MHVMMGRREHDIVMGRRHSAGGRVAPAGTVLESAPGQAPPAAMRGTRRLTLSLAGMVAVSLFTHVSPT